MEAAKQDPEMRQRVIEEFQKQIQLAPALPEGEQQAERWDIQRAKESYTATKTAFSMLQLADDVVQPGGIPAFLGKLIATAPSVVKELEEEGQGYDPVVVLDKINEKVADQGIVPIAWLGYTKPKPHGLSVADRVFMNAYTDIISEEEKSERKGAAARHFEESLRFLARVSDADIFAYPELDPKGEKKPIVAAIPKDKKEITEEDIVSLRNFIDPDKLKKILNMPAPKMTYTLNKLLEKRGLRPIYFDKGEDGGLYIWDKKGVALADKKTGHIRVADEDFARDLAATVFTHGFTLGGGLLGGLAGGAAGGSATGGNPWAIYEGSALGATAGSAAGKVADEAKNRWLLGMEGLSADEAKEIFMDTAKEEFWTNQALFVGVPAAIRGLGFGWSKLVRPVWKMMKDAMGIGDPFATEVVKKQAIEWAVSHGASRKDAEFLVNKIEQYLNLPEDQRSKTLIGMVLQNDKNVIAKEAQQALKYNPKAAESLMKQAEQLTRAMKSMTKSGVSVDDLMAQMSKYDKAVKALYKEGTKQIGKMLGNETRFIINDDIRNAVVKIHESLSGIKDEPIARKLTQLTTRLFEYNDELGKWVPKKITWDDLNEVYKAISQNLDTVKTYVGMKELRQLQKGIYSLLKSANPDAAKIFQKLNSTYAEMMQFQKGAGRIFGEGKYLNKLKDAEIFQKLATEVGRDGGKVAPRAIKVLERLSPSMRQQAERKILDSMIETSMAKSGSFTVPDFATLSTKLKQIEPYANDIFKNHIGTYRLLKDMAESLKGFTPYFRAAAQSQTVGQKLTGEVNSYLSWQAVRLWRWFVGSLLPWVSKDAAFDKAVAQALTQTSARSLPSIMAHIGKKLGAMGERELAAQVTRYSSIISALNKLKKGKANLNNIESYAMFGVPFGLNVQTDKDGRIEKIEFDSTNALTGMAVAAIFQGHVPARILAKLKNRTLSQKEAWKEFGIYKAKDGSFRMMIEGKDFKIRKDIDKLIEAKKKELQPLLDEITNLEGEIKGEILKQFGPEAMHSPEAVRQLGGIVAPEKAKKYNEIMEKIIEKRRFKLSQILEKGERTKIIQHEPYLKNVEVDFQPMEPGNMGYSDAGNKIVLNTGYLHSEGMKITERTLTHEVQHKIQDAHEWASGGGMENAAWIVAGERFPEAKKYIEKMGEAMKKGDDAALAKWGDKLQAFMEKHGYSSPQDFIEVNKGEVFDTYRKFLGEMNAEFAAYTRGMSEKDIKKMIDLGITPNDWIKKKYRLKSWKEARIPDRDTPFLAERAHLTTKDAINAHITHKIVTNPEKIDEIEQLLSKTKRGQKALEEAKRLGITGYLSLIPKERADIVTKETVGKMYEFLKSGKAPGVQRLVAGAAQGKLAKGWIEKSQKLFEYIFGKEDSDRIAALAAAFSPKTKAVDTNLENALKVWNAWVKAGRPRDPEIVKKIVAGNSKTVPSNKGLAVRALIKGKLTTKGENNLKTEDWWGVLSGKRDVATLDQHMTDELGINPTKKHEYLIGQIQHRLAAKILTEKTGVVWTPKEVQEANWAFTKAVKAALDKYGKLNLNKVLAEAEGKNFVSKYAGGIEGYAEALLQRDNLRKLLIKGGYGDKLKGAEKYLAKLDRNIGRGQAEKIEYVLTGADRKGLRQSIESIAAHYTTPQEKALIRATVKAKNLDWKVPGAKVSEMVLDPQKAPRAIYVGGKPVRLTNADAVINLTPVGGVSNEAFERNPQKFISEVKAMARKHGVKLKGRIAVVDGLFEGEKEKSMQFVVRGDKENVKRFVSEYGKKYGQWSVHLGELGKKPLSIMMKVPKGKEDEVSKLLQKHGFAGATYDNGYLRLDFIKQYNPKFGKPGFHEPQEMKKFIEEARALAKDLGTKPEFKNVEVLPIFNGKFVNSKNLETYDKYIKVHPATIGAMLGFRVEKDKDGNYKFTYDPASGALGVLGEFVAAKYGILDEQKFKALIGSLIRLGKFHVPNAHKMVMDIKFLHLSHELGAAADHSNNDRSER